MVRSWPGRGAPTPGIDGVEHRPGRQPDQLGPGHRRAGRRPARRPRSGPTASGSMRFIDTCTWAPTCRPRARTAFGPRTSPATVRASSRSGVGQPQVVGHEHGSGADADGAGPSGRPRPGRRRGRGRGTPGDGPRATSARGRSRSTGTPSSPAAQAAKRSRAPTASSRVERPSGTNGTTSTTPRRGWAPVWPRRSSDSTAGGGHRPGGVLADEGEHAAVVIGVGVHVEQLAPGVAGDQLDRRRGRRPSLMLTTHSSTGEI